jgi:hypothetical protein
MVAETQVDSAAARFDTVSRRLSAWAAALGADTGTTHESLGYSIEAQPDTQPRFIRFLHVVDIRSDSDGAYLLATRGRGALERISAIYKLRLTPEMLRALLANTEVRERRSLEAVAVIERQSPTHFVLEADIENTDGEEWAEPVISSLRIRLMNGRLIAFASSFSGETFSERMLPTTGAR